MKPTDFARRADAIIAAAASDATTADSIGGDSASDDFPELPLLRGERMAGRVLTRFVVATGLLTVLTAAAAAALAWLGIWEPLVVSVLLVVLAALSWRVSAVMPARALPVWSALALVMISLGATTWAGLTHDERVLPRGDAGVNAQSAFSLAKGHEWPIPLSANEFGGPVTLQIPGVTIASPGFRQIGTFAEPAIEPQTLIGAPAWLSIGFWAGGVAAMLWVPALFGGLAILTIGLLTSSVVGPRWGPIGALSAVISFPVLHAARATADDIMVVFVLCSGLLMLVAATRSGAKGHWQQARAVGFLAGALVGSSSFFHLDGLGQTVVLLSVAALLSIRRDGAGAGVLWGAGVATALSALAALGLSGGLLQDQGTTWIPLGLLVVALGLLASAKVGLTRWGMRVPDRIRAVLPASAAALVTVVGLALLALPSRQALVWTAWWTGPWALVVGVVVVAAAAHRLAQVWLRGERSPGWTGAIVFGVAAASLQWLSPSGDHATPWISGDLVVGLPLVIVCAVVATAWVTRWSTRHLPTVAMVVVSVGTVAILVVPEAVATLPHADQRLSKGQVAAVQQVCRTFGPADVVLMVDDRAANEWLPTIRAQCDVPSLSLTSATRRDPTARASAVASVAQAVSTRGGRLLVMAASSAAAMTGLANRAIRIDVPIAIVRGSVTQDPLQVSGRPDGLSSFPLQVWVAAVG